MSISLFVSKPQQCLQIILLFPTVRLYNQLAIDKAY